MYARCLTRDAAPGPFTERDPVLGGTCTRAARSEEPAMTLNESAMALADEIATHAGPSRCGVSTVGGARVIDCGGAVAGGLAAGLAMARVCTAGLGRRVAPVRSRTARGAGGDRRPGPGLPGVAVRRLADQRRQVLRDGLRPDAGAAAREALFEHIPGKEQPPVAVGVLETAQAPDRGGRRVPRRPSCRRRPSSSRCWSPRRRAWPARCRSSPARSRRPCTSCTN